MKYFLIVLFTLFVHLSFGQWTIINGKQRFAQGLGIPVRDTAVGLLNDSAQIVLRPNDSTIYYKYKGAWRKVSSGGFEKNIIMNGGTGNRLGYWVDGDTIPVAGMGLDSAFKVITQRAVAPSYLKPTETISGSPSAGSYEIGSNIGTITFTTTYTQRDGGARTTDTVKRIVTGTYTNLAGYTDTISSLITARSYKAFFRYDTGACKTNNLGQIDCRGRIVAGRDSSSAITYTPVPAIYWGYLDTNLIPTSAQIRAKTGGDSLLTTTKNRVYTVNVNVANKYIYVAYPKTMGVTTSILMNNFETIDAFTPVYEVNVTNSKGYTQTYYVYVNRNPFAIGNTPFTVQ